MLHVDIPTPLEFKTLVQLRADACVAIYIPTTPLSQQVVAARIEFGNLTNEALRQLDVVGFDEYRRAAIAEHLHDLAGDDAYWMFQAHSLAALATPDKTRSYRLANRLQAMVLISDRFHLKPLIRAVTVPQHAFVLALTENDARLFKMFSDLPAVEVAIKDVPVDATSVAVRASVNRRSEAGRIQGSVGQTVLLRQYSRYVDAAICLVLSGRDGPLILAATEPLRSIFRSVRAYADLVDKGIAANPDDMSTAQLADLDRSLLNRRHVTDIEAFKALFEARRGPGARDHGHCRDRPFGYVRRGGEATCRHRRSGVGNDRRYQQSDRLRRQGERDHIWRD